MAALNEAGVWSARKKGVRGMGRRHTGSATTTLLSKTEALAVPWLPQAALHSCQANPAPPITRQFP